ELAIAKGVVLALAILELGDKELEDIDTKSCKISRRLNWRIMELDTKKKQEQVIDDICSDEELKKVMEGDTSLVSSWENFFVNSKHNARKDIDCITFNNRIRKKTDGVLLLNEVYKLNEDKVFEFTEDFNAIKEVALEYFIEHISIVEHWRDHKNYYLSMVYKRIPERDKNEVLDNCKYDREKKIVSLVNDIPVSPPFPNKSKCVAGGNINGDNHIELQYNQNVNKLKSQDHRLRYQGILANLHPLLLQHVHYLNLIRFDFLNGEKRDGQLFTKLLSYEDENFFTKKITAAALAGSHAEVLVANELFKKHNKTTDILIYVKNINDKNMQRCPNCFYLLGDKVKMIGND
ncbi:hypothetical protein, partial [Flammeovirga aprica]